MSARALISILFVVCLFFTLPVQAKDLPSAGIATAHPLATKAGHQILTEGGNAFDAAVAITAALAVVEPMSSGIGGGGFWLLHREKDQFQTMVDGREMAPLKAHKKLYQDEKGEVIPGLSIDGPLAAGIPGTIAAIAHIAKKYGVLPLKQSLAPAIKMAKQGFKSSAAYQRMAKFRLKALQSSPDAAAIFLRDNQPPEPGTLITQIDLAKTLEAVAKKGAAGFYQGSIAKKMVKGITAAGGIWQMDDLRQYTVKERKPIQGHYGGMKITSAAPPSSGGIAMMTILNILSGYDLSKFDDTAKTHHIAEAMRRAYRDRALYLGDPDFVEIPTKRLLNENYAAGLRASLRADKATVSSNLPGVSVPAQGNDTTHFSIVDKAGNRVAATLSINYPFGACFVPPGTGVLLNDEMDDFAAKPGVPNAYGLVGADANSVQAKKRPLSSMSPTFVESDKGFAVIGTPGGSRIITMVLQGILSYQEGKSAQEIVDRPRFHHQFLPDQINHEEDTFSAKQMSELQTMGHALKQSGWRFGNMQIVVWDKQKQKMSAASDHRGEGLAIVK